MLYAVGHRGQAIWAQLQCVANENLYISELNAVVGLPQAMKITNIKSYATAQLPFRINNIRKEEKNGNQFIFLANFCGRFWHSQNRED